MFAKTLIAAGLLLAFADAAPACDPPAYCPPVNWSVVCYETRCVPKTIYETRYDCRGCPYTVARTTHVKVVVTVSKRVRIG